MNDMIRLNYQPTQNANTVKEIDHILSRLNRNKNKNASDNLKKHEIVPKRQLSPEIAKLTGQLQDKFNPEIFPRETHLNKTDPGYGTPQEGSLTAARGQQAHRDICTEVVDMCQIIWDHATMSGNYDEDEEDNIACILFQDLFSVYSKISGNVSKSFTQFAYLYFISF